MTLNRLSSILKNRIGAVGWAALLIFFASRIGDVINLAAGLWLVPRFVPQGDLGDIKVLEQIASVIGVPITILAYPYIKALNSHATRGEAGKAKALMRDTFLLCAVLLVLMAIVSAAGLPWILRRWNIPNDRLAMAVIIAGMLGALMPFFTGTLQAMKKFKVYSAVLLLTPPTRFLAFLLLLPFRGLTGYFAGQSAANLPTIAATMWSFFRDFGRKVRCESYWRDNRAFFAACIVPLAVGAAAGAFRGTAEMSMLKFIPSEQSAAYYILTRFSDIVGYVIAPLTFVLFPVFSERHETGGDSGRTLARGMIFCVAVGAALGLALNLFGAQILNLHDKWSPYAKFSHLFWLLAFTTGLRFAFTCFTLRELASRRFSYNYFIAPLAALEGLAIYALGRSPYFALLNLRDVLLIHLIMPAIFFVYAVAVLAARRRKEW